MESGIKRAANQTAEPPQIVRLTRPLEVSRAAQRLVSYSQTSHYVTCNDVFKIKLKIKSFVSF